MFFCPSAFVKAVPGWMPSHISRCYLNNAFENTEYDSHNMSDYDVNGSIFLSARRKRADLFLVCYRSVETSAADLQTVYRSSTDHLQIICELSAEYLQNICKMSAECLQK